MGQVAILTDSTACLPEPLAAECDIHVVELEVIIDGVAGLEGVDYCIDDVAQALRDLRSVTTSRPSPQRMLAEYRRLFDQGASGIVSVHLSGDLSGTVDAARLAARELSDAEHPIVVVDSRTLGMGLGYAALAASRAAAQGEPLQGIAEVATRVGLASSTFVYVDTLEYLRRGGRVSGVSATMGTRLSVKPLLHLVDGRMERLELARTTSRALSRLVDVVVAHVGRAPVDIAVQQVGAEVTAKQLAERLRDRLPQLRDVIVGEMSAVIAAHCGPGTIAVVVAPPSR